MIVQTVDADWQRRPTMEQLQRFIQEAGLLVQAMQLARLNSTRRWFLLIRVTALFVVRWPDVWLLS